MNWIIIIIIIFIALKANKVCNNISMFDNSLFNLSLLVSLVNT
jgi:hypothetical protein